jgi:hypothetical protein
VARSRELIAPFHPDPKSVNDSQTWPQIMRTSLMMYDAVQKAQKN